MNIEKLQYFVEVVNTGSFLFAAQNLFVSQSAISQSISSLEKDLGVKLFDRYRGQGVVPTAEGLRIIPLARELLIKCQELEELAKSIHDRVQMELDDRYQLSIL
ncbi:MULTISPECIES: LysR family transcriptional regulator [unclassified Bacillus (in: firmicutes)]|uniref:LysR family transcriptional regulator n=1 Tax=unclassified Bacillus (in: firmicutes) TaxID=185979 RepID=UPI000BF02046|nr:MULTISPECIES: LysR family transcriptional regulator [unclassified Bacillus (in: firmicutes)]PEJ57624.1 hypothetical protein CN692_12100 [Bacillus sp. AFS002410]PEL08393.1 hypothetical protein CN601_16880 [Bacillus sp. AFS017336]